MIFSPLYPSKITPGIDLEELKKAGKDSSTTYSRFHHSTKCNGWARRYSEPEWQELFKSIITPLLAVELEELVYGAADLNARELKAPRPTREGISIFDDPMPSEYWKGLRQPAHYTKLSLWKTQEWHESRLEYRRLKYIESILHPFQLQPHEFIDPYYKERGRTNPDYWKYNAVHRFGTKGKKPIALDYYKFPVICGPLEVESTGWITLGRRKECSNSIYTVEGIQERDDFAIIDIGSKKDINKLNRGKGDEIVDLTKLAPGTFTRTFKDFLELTPYYKKKIRWSLGRGSYGSNHNERGQVVSRDPLDPRMVKVLKRECPGESPDWVKNLLPADSESTCKYCGGVVRYSNKLELICDSCSTSFGFRIDNNEHIEERELSGDDDNWKTDEMLRLEADEAKLKHARRTAKRLKDAIKQDEKIKEFEEKGKLFAKEKRQSSYIKSDYRERKSHHLDKQIVLLLDVDGEEDGEGIYQRDLSGLLLDKFGVVVTERAMMVFW